MTGVTHPWHKDGVPWWEAPLPRRWHRCRPQTSGFVGGLFDGRTVYRCACGAMRTSNHWQWMDKNQRRRK